MVVVFILGIVVGFGLLDERIDIITIAGIGRDTSGGGVRLSD